MNPPCCTVMMYYFYVPHFSDKKVELKKLNRSILVCFLELLDILITNPASPAVSICCFLVIKLLS